MSPRKKQSYGGIAAVARARRDSKINAFYRIPAIAENDLPSNLIQFALESGYYTREELEVIASSAPDILYNVSSGRWTSLRVVRAFCKASAFAQRLTNCLSDVFYEEAEARARYLDAYLEEFGETVGPLHGLPISLPDSFNIAPHPTSMGVVAYANEPTDTDSIIVTILRKLGAVLFVKTNVPQANMMIEVDNNIYGPTCNPYNKLLSSGGVSGGESALIALHASPVGFGVDICGGVRTPAASCNLYGLKPSAGRLPLRGRRQVKLGLEFVNHSLGLMASSLHTLKFLCQTLLSVSTAPWDYDAKCLHMPWRKHVIFPSGRRLRFGIVGIDDGFVTCHPPVERALRIVRHQLEQAGHEVFPWSVHDHMDIIELSTAMLYDVGAADVFDGVLQTDEPVFPSLQGVVQVRHSKVAELCPGELRATMQRRNRLQESYLDRWMATASAGKPPMDGLIMAVSPWAAAKTHAVQHCTYLGYNSVFSILDYTACTFPVTFVDKDLDPPRTPFSPLSHIDAAIQATYDAEVTHGAPVALQVVGRRYEEEKVLEMVGIISQALNWA